MTKPNSAQGEAGRGTGNVVPLRPALELRVYRTVVLELPQFLVLALERRVSEANEDPSSEEMVTLNDYIEYELGKLISIVEMAEIEMTVPGFTEAVSAWVEDMRQ